MSKTLKLRISDELADLIQAEAARRGTTISKLITKALLEDLAPKTARSKALDDLLRKIQ